MTKPEAESDVASGEKNRDALYPKENNTDYIEVRAISIITISYYSFYAAPTVFFMNDSGQAFLAAMAACSFFKVSHSSSTWRWVSSTVPSLWTT